MSEFRIEHDLLGEREVPVDAYYGVHTLRACENFQISGTPVSIFPELVIALASVKQAAAEANTELGLRSEEHTSELQSLMRISYAVFCLKKKKNNRTQY